MRPKSINLFETLGWAATGAGALSVLIMLIQAVSQRPGPPAAGYLLLLFVLLLFAALAGSVFYAAKRRHDVGRWGFVVVAAVIGVLLLTRIDGFALADGMGLLYLLLDMVTLGALMAATIALLQPDAQAWFAQGPIIPVPAPAVQPPYPGYGAPQPGAGGYPPAAYPSAAGYPPAVPDASQPAGYPPQAPAAPVAALAEGTRRCPYCAEEIRVEASKCRHCGSAVEPLAG